MPGLVVEVLVEVGEVVEAGRPLVVVEAMKMQNALAAPVSGTVCAIAVAPGAPVDTGQLLMTLTPRES
jgi:biotin carboxyl carrier protein